MRELASVAIVAILAWLSLLLRCWLRRHWEHMLRKTSRLQFGQLGTDFRRGTVDAHHVDDLIPFGGGSDSEMDFERREDGMQPIDEQ